MIGGTWKGGYKRRKRYSSEGSKEQGLRIKESHGKEEEKGDCKQRTNEERYAKSFNRRG